MPTASTRLVLFSIVVIAACKDPSKSSPAATVSAPVTGSSATLPAGSASEVLPFNSEGSKLAFVGSKVTGSHEGAFSRFRGTVTLVGGKAEGGGVTADVDADSLTIEPAKLQGHLKSADFFDTGRFSNITFRSTEIKAGGPPGATHTITGNLAMHGVEKSISFPATVHVGDAEVAATSEFTINRRDFGIVYPGMPNDLIRDGVVVKIDLHAPRRR